MNGLVIVLIAIVLLLPVIYFMDAGWLRNGESTRKLKPLQ